MAKRRRLSQDSIVLRIPLWVGKIYVMLAAVLLPWTIYLGLTLPDHHLSTHWSLSWTGLDIGLVLSLAATGFFAYIRSIWIIIAAASTGSLLLVDAWFDVTSERIGPDLVQALILATMLELPLAAISYYVASHAVRHNLRRR